MNILDKTALQTLRPEINAALAVVAERHGIVLTLGSGSYNPSAPTHASFKLEISAKDASGVVILPEAEAYKKHHALFQLPADGLGKLVRWGGREFVVIGLCINSHKFPLLVKNEKGKHFKLPAAALTLKATTIPAS